MGHGASGRSLPPEVVPGRARCSSQAAPCSCPFLASIPRAPFSLQARQVVGLGGETAREEGWQVVRQAWNRPQAPSSMGQCSAVGVSNAGQLRLHPWFPDFGGPPASSWACSRPRSSNDGRNHGRSAPRCMWAREGRGCSANSASGIFHCAKSQAYHKLGLHLLKGPQLYCAIGGV